MIKLLDYTNKESFTELIFEKNQCVRAYIFAHNIFLETSDGITKASVSVIKNKMAKEGLSADLSEFIGRSFIEYGELLYSEDDLLKTFDAGCAYTVGSHKDFKQSHPNRKQWVESLKKEKSND